MADIELVVKIPEETYKGIMLGKWDGNGLAYYVKVGTLLPKGHGDLMDKNELIKRYEKDCGRRIYVDNFIHDIELNMQTIIEADKAESEDKE